MKIDKIDIKMINLLYNIKKKKELTTSDIVKKIFTSKLDRREFQKKDTMVRNKLEKLNKINIIEKKESEKFNLYRINYDKVICGSGSININPDIKNESERNFDSDNILLISNENGFYAISYIKFDKSFKSD